MIHKINETLNNETTANILMYKLMNWNLMKEVIFLL